MQVHYSIDNLPGFKNTVVTVGTFDGVHLGHRQIINQLKEEAIKVNGETVIITFHPHPRTIVSNKPIELLNSLNEKIFLIDALGVDHLIVVPFDETFSNQTPEQYVRNFLFEKFHPHTIIIGYDHKFGKHRAGDYKLLEAYGKELGFVVKEIPEKVINESVVSSTIIREALLQYNIETANKYLGYDYFFEGLVVDGNKLGRTLGYPTANIIIRDEMKLIPANGIYVAEAELQNHSGKKLQGMMSIGVRPTIDGQNRTIEMNIFNFEKDIYGETIKIYVQKFLREEEKFNSLEELVAQMKIDKLNSLNFFKSRTG